MKLFNSMTMKKEEFVPIEAGKVKMYVCGPTVYNYIHVGNSRPVIIFDTLRRYFEYRGYEVTFVQNFTDIDDKIIKKAWETGESWDTVAERYIEEYLRDAKGLNIKEDTVHPKATENIGEIIEIVKTLIDKGYAYESGGDVYFKTAEFSEYGKLSHQPLEELTAGARVDVNESKENPMDFALWKAAKPGEPYWESPWGRGRPGWHIECSAMSCRYLGKTVDIHGGGQDLIFPHHENELAQSEAANGQKFVNYWMHNAYLNIENKKMSKSAGNFFTVREAAEEYGYETLRMFMLTAHYRSPLNYSEETLTQTKNALNRLKTAKSNLEFLMENTETDELTDMERAFIEDLSKYREHFIEALDDDFNTADAISVIFEMVRDINSAVQSENNPSKALARGACEAFSELTDTLGLLYGGGEEAGLDDEVEALIKAREQARREKNYAAADEMRGRLTGMGIVLEDTPQGVKWKRV